MAKKEVNEEIKELKIKVLDGKVILGRERVIKSLQSDKLSKILMASNCPDKIKEDIVHYAKLADVVVVNLEQDNEELGIVCKKNFFVSVIGII